MTMQLHTMASYLWHFLSIKGEKILCSKVLGSCGGCSKIPFPNTAFPQHQPLPVAPSPQTPVGALERGTAPHCCTTRVWAQAVLLQLLPTSQKKGRQARSCFPAFLGNCWAGCGKQSTGNLPLDQLELQAHGALFHE